MNLGTRRALLVFTNRPTGTSLFTNFRSCILARTTRKPASLAESARGSSKSQVKKLEFVDSAPVDDEAVTSTNAADYPDADEDLDDELNAVQEESAEEILSEDDITDSTDDPVRMYLKQMGQVPLLTREQEVEISKRIETAELKAQEALFQAAVIGGYIGTLGAKLLTREERFDRVVIDKKIDSREAYFKSLPKLVETTQKCEGAVAESWQEYLKARGEPARKKVMAKHRKRETALRACFSKFYFKLKVYEEYLEQLRPALEDIETAHRQIERAKHPKTKRDTQIDVKAVNGRLRQHEVDLRIHPDELLKVVAQTRVHVAEAHKAKTEMVEANRSEEHTS